MNAAVTVTQKQLADFLLNVALVRPVFIWGPPGIGKSALVQQFAAQLGLPCVSLLGSQLAPEDLIGVPQIVDGTSRFCPPRMIARAEPYCLFLDELNACSHEVQKAFYSLIHERRIGEYELPAGSIVVGAGNRAQDSAIVKPMSSALLNRMVHVRLRVSHRDWLEWAGANGIHALVLEYIQARPDQLWSQPPKHEEPFSTPRSWHILSDALHAHGAGLTDERLEVLAFGCLSPQHAGQFKAFVKQLRSKYGLAAILKGELGWPARPEDRDVLYFLAQSFRAQLIKELPPDAKALTAGYQEVAHRGKALIKELAQISLEIAQMVVSETGDGEALPGWFMVEIVRDLPRLVEKKNVPRKRDKGAQAPRNIAAENFQHGEMLVSRHPIFAPLFYHVSVVRQEGNLCPKDGWAVITRGGALHVHPTRRGEPAEWAYVIAHCLLHLAFGHFQAGKQPREWNAACDLFVARFLADLKFGRPPDDMGDLPPDSARDETRLYRELCARGLPPEFRAYGTGGPHADDMVWGPEQTDWHGHKFDWTACLAQGLALAVSEAVRVAAGEEPGSANRRTPGQEARAWFIDHYPLLGALAATFDIIEDQQICIRLGISVAAVDAQTREIFINPAAGLDMQEYRFVMAHELLHVGLRHDTRQQGREPFLWNCAADYVINSWLVEMGVGALPSVGVLYDPALKDESAESIYDRLATDLRHAMRLWTFRGFGVGDILEPRSPDWWNSPAGCDLDDFYRRALSQGLLWHQEQGRGFLPAGLVEEIRALSLPPIPWDVALARWFDEHFPPLEQRRSYARLSRRQSATPDIPRPRYVPLEDTDQGRTFGVVLDTSGSMDRQLLGQALGAIASYSLARDVHAARVVFCDAAPYDQGYMPPEDIAGRVQVRGRGGTVLQPGIDLLEAAEDFPKDGPLLIITDAKCDRIHVRRDHALLVPPGARLPFAPRGPVFRIGG